jgi:hypothetical protein
VSDRVRLARPAIMSLALRVGTAAGLGIDAVIHWQNAPAYDAVAATVSQGALYRYVDVGALGPLPDM